MKPSLVTNVSPSLGTQFAVEAVLNAPRIENILKIKKRIANSEVAHFCWVAACSRLASTKNQKTKRVRGFLFLPDK